MILPPMQTEDALKFVKDVLAHSRPAEYADIDPYFPFSEDTCRVIIEDIQKKEELKPRAIMQAFNNVLQEADAQNGTGAIKMVSPALAERVLAELVQLE